MGLDMYLEVQKYVGGWNHSSDKEKDAFKSIVSAIGFSVEDVANGSPSVTVDVTVAYWRKANAVHAWFVDKVQRGVDECQESYVTREQLEELVKDCKQAIKDKGKSMPPRSGFFFGSTETDEYYFEDLKYTIKTVEEILKNPRFKDCSFYYRASW